MITSALMSYLGHGVSPATILREGADLARRHGAPHDIVARMEAAATAYAATGVYPDWAAPAQSLKRHTYAIERQQEEAGT